MDERLSCTSTVFSFFLNFDVPSNFYRNVFESSGQEDFRSDLTRLLKILSLFSVIDRYLYSFQNCLPTVEYRGNVRRSHKYSRLKSMFGTSHRILNIHMIFYFPLELESNLCSSLFFNSNISEPRFICQDIFLRTKQHNSSCKRKIKQIRANFQFLQVTKFTKP